MDTRMKRKKFPCLPIALLVAAPAMAVEGPDVGGSRAIDPEVETERATLPESGPRGLVAIAPPSKFSYSAEPSLTTSEDFTSGYLLGAIRRSGWEGMARYQRTDPDDGGASHQWRFRLKRALPVSRISSKASASLMLQESHGQHAYDEHLVLLSAKVDVTSRLALVGNVGHLWRDKVNGPTVKDWDYRARVATTVREVEVSGDYRAHNRVSGEADVSLTLGFKSGLWLSAGKSSTFSMGYTFKR
jgi:hypothetical protein